MGWSKLITPPATVCIAGVLDSRGKSKGTRTGIITRDDAGVFHCEGLAGVTHYDMDIYTRDWIIENSVSIISRYGTGELTLRALHYQLVGRGMFNTMQHYKRVVKAMEVARWDGVVDFEAFSDLKRAMVGETRADETDVDTEISSTKSSIDYWMKNYRKNRWENQPVYPELWIEKQALQMMFQRTCERNRVGLGAVSGYPSLTFLHEAAQRFIEKDSDGKECVILYFGDYDPSGEDIPRSIEENLRRMGANVEVRRFALFEEQVTRWNLPPAPTKDTDSRTANWDGLGQVELDAVDRDVLQGLAQDAINSVFDEDLHAELMEQEEQEREQYVKELKEYVQSL